MSRDHYIAAVDPSGVQHNAIVNTDSGFFGSFISADGGYNTAVAQGFDTGVTVMVSWSHYQKIEQDCRAVRANIEVSVEVPSVTEREAREALSVGSLPVQEG